MGLPWWYWYPFEVCGSEFIIISIQDLSSLRGIKPTPPAVEVGLLTTGLAREVLTMSLKLNQLASVWFSSSNI